MYGADYNMVNVPVTGLKICSWVASSGLHGFPEKFFQYLNFQLSSRLGEANFSVSADIYPLVQELLKWRVK